MFFRVFADDNYHVLIILEAKSIKKHFFLMVQYIDIDVKKAYVNSKVMTSSIVFMTPKTFSLVTKYVPCQVFKH